VQKEIEAIYKIYSTQHKAIELAIINKNLSINKNFLKGFFDGDLGLSIIFNRPSIKEMKESTQQYLKIHKKQNYTIQYGCSFDVSVILSMDARSALVLDVVEYFLFFPYQGTPLKKESADTLVSRRWIGSKQIQNFLYFYSDHVPIDLTKPIFLYRQQNNHQQVSLNLLKNHFEPPVGVYKCEQLKIILLLYNLLEKEEREILSKQNIKYGNPSFEQNILYNQNNVIYFLYRLHFFKELTARQQFHNTLEEDIALAMRILNRTI
jgi:hypothetical protein